MSESSRDPDAAVPPASTGAETARQGLDPDDTQDVTSPAPARASLPPPNEAVHLDPETPPPSGVEAASAASEPSAAAPPPRPPAVPGRAQVARPSPVPLLALLAAGLVLLVSLYLWLTKAPEPGAQIPAAGVGAEAPPAAPAVRVLAVVRDLPGELAILSDERVRGLEPVAAAEQRRVARAVLAGELSPAPDAVALRGTAELQPADAPLRPLTPVATRVSDERPLLRWSAAEEPAVYVVTVVDASGQLLVSSPPLAGTEWQPPRALPRRRALGWYVESRPRSRGVEAQRSALARFAVLGGEELAWLEREIQAGRRSLLLTAVLEAEVGAFDDAAAALDELIAANPGSAELARLREQLRRASAP